MYRLGHRRAHHYLLYGGLSLVLIGLLVVGGVAIRSILQPHTVLKQAKPITHTVTAGDAVSRQITKDIFTLQLPADWRATEAPKLRYNTYSWTGSGVLGGARRLDVYIDVLPLDMPVNRLLPAAANGASLDITGTVSDNCVNFTDKTAQSTYSGHAASKWGGVSFICDMANYERDVVATGSDEGVNYAALTGSKTGKHRVLLAYTDNNANPDYAIFLAIVKSFHLL